MSAGTNTIIRELSSIASSIFDPDPIAFRAADEAGVRPVRKACVINGDGLRKLSVDLNRNAFLCGCLDFTEHESIEHLIIGLGRKFRSTTKIQSLFHTTGSSRAVALPQSFKDIVGDFVMNDEGASILIFHNHPMNDIRRLLDNSPLASDADRKAMFELRSLSLRLARRNALHFYLGENGFVRQFRIPQLIDVLNTLTKSD